MMHVSYAAVLLAASLALTSARDVVVINTGNDAIFALRVGDAQAARWSDDLLGFAGVIDVSRGRTVALPVDRRHCLGDVEATFRGGATVVVRNVNLCRVQHLAIGNR